MDCICTCTGSFEKNVLWARGYGEYFSPRLNDGGETKYMW